MFAFHALKVASAEDCNLNVMLKYMMCTLVTRVTKFVRLRCLRMLNPVSILYKSIGGPLSARHDGPISARYRFIKNASGAIL